MTENQNELQLSNEPELQTLMLDETAGSVFIGTSSVIGKRREQQDSIRADNADAYLENGKAIAVLCDGMGGLFGGEKASALCASMIFDAFHQEESIESMQKFYGRMIVRADRAVRELKSDEGLRLNAGTTLVSVAIENGHLYWATVGDSRVYIIRGNEIVAVNRDHNFLMLLNERVKRGEITQEEANSNPKKEALISYIGMGGIQYVDMNSKPFQLLNNDLIVLCSDGLYRSLSAEEIKGIASQFANDTQMAAEALTNFALNKGMKNQDNTSVVVVNYQKNW